MNSSSSQTAERCLASAYDRTNNKMIVDSKLYGSNDSGTTWRVVKTDSSGNVKNIITDGTDDATVNANVDNSAIKGLDTNSYLMAYNRTNTANEHVTSVKPISNSPAVRALETYSYTVGLSDTVIAGNRVPLQITSTTGETTQSLDVLVQNPSTSNSYNRPGTTNFSMTGLNMYQIFPRKKTFTWSGRTSDNITGNTYTVIGGINGNVVGGGNMTSISYQYGKVPNIHYASATALGYTLVYSYVDANYNLVEDEEKVLTTTGTTLAGGLPIFCVLKMALKEGNQSVNVNIYYEKNNNLTYRIGYLSNVIYYNGLITIPNGWIGKISNLYFFCSASQNWSLIKYNSNNLNQETIARGANFSNSVIASSPEGYGGLLLPGETILMIRENIATTTEFIGCVTMEQIS